MDLLRQTQNDFLKEFHDVKALIESRLNGPSQDNSLVSSINEQMINDNNWN